MICLTIPLWWPGCAATASRFARCCRRNSTLSWNAIIGGVGPAEFYAKAVNAALIPDSTPGIYRGLLNVEALQTETTT